MARLLFPLHLRRPPGKSKVAAPFVVFADRGQVPADDSLWVVPGVLSVDTAMARINESADSAQSGGGRCVDWQCHSQPRQLCFKTFSLQ